MKTFGELRSLLHDDPTPDSWDQICEWLDANFEGLDADETAHRVAQHLPYILGVTRRWPTSLRQPPWRWLRALLEGSEHPRFGVIGSLRLRSRLHRDGLLAIAQNPHLEQVAELYLLGWEPTPDLARALARGAVCRDLRMLEIWGTGLGLHPGARGHGFGSGGVRHLLGPHLARTLEVLDIQNTRLEAADLAAITDTPWGALRRLNLWHTGLDDDGATRLASSPHLAGLETLRLDLTRISSRGLNALRTSHHLSQEVLAELRR